MSNQTDPTPGQENRAEATYTPGRDRPSKRYILTSYSDAYRLDRESPTTDYQLPPSLLNQLQPGLELPDSKLIEELEHPAEEPLAKADRRGGTLGKSAAGLNGLKLAIRGDSSFFAHGYRFTIVLMFGVMIQLPPIAWLILSLCAGLVLIAEIFNSAIDTLSRTINLDAEHSQAARDIGSSGVLVSVIISVAVTIALFGIRFQELLTQ